MKLLRYGPKGKERPALLDDHGVIRDIGRITPDLGGVTVSTVELDKLRDIDPENFAAVEGTPRVGACLTYVPNFYCVGLNYAKHAAESGMDAPKEPVLFTKATSALSGPFDNVIIPKDSTKPDWEVELGVVIGKHAEHVSEAEALNYVAGYCIVNDVSEREFQLERGGQWMKGKSAPTYGPTGPWLVTADEIPDPQALSLTMRVNNEVKQSSNTSDMIFGVAEIISYMSRFMALVPGDIIATGTPEGVGMGQKPPQFLKPGDVMELEIAGLGLQRQDVVAYPG
ncbi:MAG: fumarylacetoacetate hydrolase family protein [Marinosulfonomonas sp.]